jgi:mono/diheme cytochrome c family protein
LVNRAVLAGVVLVVACGGGGSNADAGQPPQTAAAPAAAADRRADLFIRKGCPQCHAISALGVTSPAEVGPDLSGAHADVRSRFGVSLEEFFAAPTGTMQLVLSSMIQLTPAERDSIIQILKELQ